MFDTRTFTEDVRVFVKVLDDTASKALAEAANKTRDQLVAEQTQRRGVVPGVLNVVDGARDGQYENVKPDGVIYIQFDYIPETVKAAFDELQARVPTGPGRNGHYRDAFFCIVDGAHLPPMQIPTAAQVRDAQQIIVTNDKPYSRKLDVGTTQGGESFIKRADPHFFESTVAPERREFGALYKIEWGFTDLPGAYTLQLDHASGRAHASKGHRSGDVIRYPALFIERQI